MFNVILTLIRGRAYDAEQAFIDRNAMPLLAQQIRELRFPGVIRPYFIHV